MTSWGSIVSEAESLTDPFETRASRAEALSRDSQSAGEALAFAAKLFRAQGRIASAVAARHADAPLTGRLEDDLGRLTDLLPRFLDLAARGAPEILAEEVRARRGDDDVTARARLLVYWQGGREASEDYVSRAFLRPYVEVLARVHVPPERLHREGHCPFCGGAPIISFRRSEPDSHGANRHLACALCGGTWVYPRVRCVSCEEDDPPKLPAFQSPAHAAVRIEACETCKRFMKSIDLTLDARPIPEVDDLVSIAMDLWAIEQGYTRVEPGWAGI